MEPLTKTEERVMQILWKIKKGVVRDIIGHFDPEPPYTTISSVVRILEDKGYVGHKAYGRTHEYFPLITRGEYRQSSFKRLLSDYFEGSYENVVSFLIKEEEISKDEIQDLLDQIDTDEKSSPS